MFQWLTVNGCPYNSSILNSEVRNREVPMYIHVYMVKNVKNINVWTDHASQSVNLYLNKWYMHYKTQAVCV